MRKENKILKILLKNILNEALKYPRLSNLVVGGISALGMAPLNFTSILIFGIAFLFWQTLFTTSRFKSFQLGLIFGFAYFLVGCHWISHAVIVVGMPYLVPPALIGIPLAAGLYWGLACLLCWNLGTSVTTRALSFTIALGAAEILKGKTLTGFPWNLPGYTWGLELLQSTAFINIYGLTILTILCASILITKSFKAIIPVWSLMVALYGWGYYRLHNTVVETTEISMRIVQPCIDQGEKWKSELFWVFLKRFVELSSIPSKRPLSAIIWPEAAIPSFYNTEIKNFIINCIPKNGLLLTGAPRLVNEDAYLDGLYTSLLVINDQGLIVDTYDKIHLVPFGEYVPFKKYLPLGKVTHGLIDYLPGLIHKPMNQKPLPPFQPLICYEAIFPGEVLPSDLSSIDSRPQWLLNITNDAWYGNSWGPSQHLSIVRVRAIEEGLPLIRAANNGISAVITPLGQIKMSLELNKIGIIDFKLPKHFNNFRFYGSLYCRGPLLILIFILGIYLITEFNLYRKRTTLYEKKRRFKS